MDVVSKHFPINTGRAPHKMCCYGHSMAKGLNLSVVSLKTYKTFRSRANKPVIHFPNSKENYSIAYTPDRTFNDFRASKSADFLFCL